MYKILYKNFIFVCFLLGAHLSFALPESGGDPKKDLEKILQKNFETLSFEENNGQFQEDVLFKGKNPQLHARFLSNSVSFVVKGKKENAKNAFVWNMNFLGGNAEKVEVRKQQPGVLNYMGNNKAAKDIKRWGELWYENLYDGIDARFYSSKDGLMEYDFVIAPHKDPSTISYELEGIDKLYIDNNGNLIMVTPFGEMSKNKPFTYQLVNGKRKEVASRFVINKDQSIGFSIDEAYDKTQPLVIDPLVMEWSSFIGNNPTFVDMKVDAAGNTFILGYEASGDAYPTTPGVYQAASAGFDVFVTKLSPTGNTLIYSTYFGGADGEKPFGLEINAAGEVFFGALSNGPSPVAPSSGAVDIAPTQTNFIHFVKLNATGTALVYNARYGYSGSFITTPTFLLTSAEEMMVVGAYSGTSAGFTTTPGAIRPSSDLSGVETYAIKLNSTGSSLVYSTFIGGNSSDLLNYAQLDAADNLYLFGITNSPDFITSAGVVQNTYGGGTLDTYITKLTPTGSLGFSTYLGKNGTQTFDAREIPGDLFVSPAGDVYGIMLNAGANLPTSAGAVQPVRLSDPAVHPSSYVFKLNTTGTALDATYMTSSTVAVGQLDIPKIANLASPKIIALPSGEVVVQNYIGLEAPVQLPHPNGGDLGGFPISPDAFQSELAGIFIDNNFLDENQSGAEDIISSAGFSDISVTRFTSDFTGINYSTLIGGLGIESVNNMSVDSDGQVYLHGIDAVNLDPIYRYPATPGSVNPEPFNLEQIVSGGSLRFLTILNETGSGLCYSTFLSSGEGNALENTEELSLEMQVTAPNEVYLGASNLELSHLGTANAFQSFPDQLVKAGGMVITKFDVVPVITNTVSPIDQTACRFATPDPILGSDPSISDPLPDLVVASVAEPQPDPLAGAISYQWQFRQPTGTTTDWTDVSGATQKNYLPVPTAITTEFRRLVIVNCDTTISDVHTLIIDQSRTAPDVNPGLENIFACTQPGVPVDVPLGGSPTASGGEGAPYTYSWSPSDGLSSTTDPNPTASLLDGVLYTLTVTDGAGCVKTAQTNVKIIIADAGPDVFACQGTWIQTEGVKIGSPAVPDLQYSWSPSTGLSSSTVAQPIANPSGVTTYTLTITAPNGCTTTDQVTVTPQQLSLNIADVRICADSPWAPDQVPDPAIGIPADPNFSYVWSPGNLLSSVTEANPTFSVTNYNMTGILPEYNPADWSSSILYQITAIDNVSGCVVYDTMRVTVDPLPVTAGRTVGVCPTTNGQTIGVFTPADSPPGTGYVWTNGNFDGESGSVASTDLNAPTTYNTTISGIPWSAANSPKYLVATTPRGCKNYEITGCLPPCGSTTSVFLCNGQPRQIGSRGPSGSTYSWSGPTAITETTAFITVSAAGTYTLTITDPLGNVCIEEYVVSPATVFQDAPDILSCSSELPVTIGSAQISGYAYQWSNGSTLSSDVIAQPTATPLTSTTYTVLVTETATGCFYRDTVKVVLNDPIIDAGPDLTFCENIIVDLGTPEVPGQTYSWQPSTGLTPSGDVAMPQVSLFSSQTFVLTVTDPVSGCSVMDTVVYTKLDKPTADAGPATVDICPGGTVQLGGNVADPALVYNWSPATNLSSTTVAQPLANPTSNTTYVLTVSYANSQGCDNDDQVLVSVGTATPPTADAGTDQTFCPTSAPITIGTAEVSGLTYSWSPTSGLSNPSIAQPTITGPISSATTYILTVTDPTTGCTATDDVVISPSVVADAGSPKSFCEGGDPVQIGTAPIAGLTYSWSPATGLSSTSVAQPEANPTQTTTYTLTVSGGGCSATSNVTVSVNQAPTVNAGEDVIICQNGSTILNGTVSVGASFSWSPGTGLSCTNCLDPIASPTANTVYTLTASTLSGCSTSDDVVVALSPSPAPVADAGPDKLVCKGGSVQIGTPAESGNTYSWSPSTNLSNPNIAQPSVLYPSNSSSPLTYTVTVTNSNGCSSTDQVVVSPSVATAVVGSDATICIGSTVQLGGTALPGYTYSWTPSTSLSCGSCANPVASPSVTTTYNLAVTNADGCFASNSVTVTVLSTPITINAGQDVAICAGETVQIGSSAQTGYTYSWSPSSSLSSSTDAQPLATPLSTTTYTVTVNSGTCIASDEVEVIVNPAPTADAGADGVFCAGGTGILLGSPAQAGFTYSWSPSTGLDASNIAQPTATPTATTFYTVTITETATGCSATDDVLVTVKPAISAINAGTDQDLCGTTTTTLTADALEAGLTGLWTQTSGPSTATFVSETSNSTTVNDLTAGTYIFRWTVSNGVCTVFDEVSVVIAASCCTQPTATASVSNATCTGPTSNSDGSITIAAFAAGGRYQYSTGATFNAGNAIPGSITAIPAGGVIVNNLANVTETYTVRIYNPTDDACYIDRVVNQTVTDCSCPIVDAPAVSDASRCEAGTLTATLTTVCVAGNTLAIFSDAALTADVTSQFTITAGDVTSPSLSTTTTYYAACVNDVSPACKSAGDPFVMTINALPSTTAVATTATCNGPTPNDDGTITLSGFTTETFDFNVGEVYTGTATFATATAIPAGGVIVNNLPNPATSQSYTVRIFNAAGCFIDRTVTLMAASCACPVVDAPAVADMSRCAEGTLTTAISTVCVAGNSLAIFSDMALTANVTSQFTITAGDVTSPSLSSTTTYYAACVSDAFPTCMSTGDEFVLTITPTPSNAAPTSTAGTCNGANLNDDATISITSIVGDKIAISTADAAAFDGAAYATATTVSGGAITFNNLVHGATYIIRIYNTEDCTIDVTFTTAMRTCCPTPNCATVTVIKN